MSLKSLSQDHLLSIISGYLHTDPTQFLISDLKGGYLNKTLLLSNNHEEYVIWIDRQKSKDKSMRQQIAMTLLSQKGFPVPTTHLRASHEKTGYFLLMDRLSGTNAESSLEFLTEDQQQLLFFQAGELLGQIHASYTSDRVGFLETPPTPYVSWRTWLESRVDKWLSNARRSFYEVWGEQSDDEWTRLLRILAEHFNKLPDVTSCHLLHGDFYLGNLLQHNNRITGILDFEWSLWGDRLYDFRVMDLFVFPLFGNEQPFLNGYRTVMPLPENHQQWRDFYQALYRLELIWMAHELFEGNTEMASEHAIALRHWIVSNEQEKGGI